MSTKQPGFQTRKGTSKLLTVPDMQIILPELQYFHQQYLKNHQLLRISSMQCSAHTIPIITGKIQLHSSPLKGNGV